MPGCFLFFSMPGRDIGMSVGLPHGFVVFVAVFLWCQSYIAFKNLYKVTLWGKGKIRRNIHDRLIRISEKMSGFFYFLFTDIVTDRYTKILLKYTGKIIAGQPCMVSQILNGDSFFYVNVDIVDAFNDRFGQSRTCLLYTSPSPRD